MDFLRNCVFMDEAGFDINMRSPQARSLSDTPTMIETQSTRAISHTILRAMTAYNVVDIRIREPLKSKKIKVAGSKRPTGR